MSKSMEPFKGECKDGENRAVGGPDNQNIK